MKTIPCPWPAKTPHAARPVSGLLALVSLGLAVALSGCGGNGGSSTASLSGDVAVEHTYGDFTTRVVGTAQPPVVSASASIAVTGIAGASFTTIYQNRSAEAISLSNSKIAFEAQDSNPFIQIFTIPALGGTPTQITSGNNSKESIIWQPGGTRFAYIANDAQGTQIYVVSANGGTPTQITQGHNNGKNMGGYSPDGTKIVYSSFLDSGNYQLFTVPATGGASTQLTTDATDKLYPAWSPDGKYISFVSPDSNNVYQINLLNLANGRRTQITSGNVNCVKPVWSPDGTRFAFYGQDASHHNQIFTVGVTGGTPLQITQGDASHAGPTWSPDSARITYSGTDAGGVNQVYTISALGGNPTQITYGFPDKFFPVWSPYLNAGVTLIGTGGTLGPASAGFLFAADNNNIRSVVAFDTAAATTDSRGASRVANLTPTNSVSPTLIFSITAADSLSKVSYLDYDPNGQTKTPVNVFLGTGITGALVSFNSTTGNISSVLPYTGNRSVAGSAPQVRREGKARIVTGTFTGVYDGQGRNQWPQGAHTVRFDTTGKLLSAE